MAPTVLKFHAPRFRKKIALIDYDGTIVMPKNNRPFPKDVADWQWFAPSVPDVLHATYDAGYMIIICTQQSKPWKLDMIRASLEPLNIPMYVSVATDKADYKPSTAVFRAVITDNKSTAWDTKKSFMVGDAGGRRGDWSDCDKVFADALGIKWNSPEDFFSKLAPTIPVETTTATVVVENAKATATATASLPSPKPVVTDVTIVSYTDNLVSDTPEVVIMVGYPGSGKTMLTNTLFKDKSNYKVLHGDELKTSTKMLKVAEKIVNDGNGVVFDATNPYREKRAEYIAFAKKHNLPVRCIHVATSMDDSIARNHTRPKEKQVPRIVYNIYKKRFETPTEEEGFVLVTI